MKKHKPNHNTLVRKEQQKYEALLDSLKRQKEKFWESTFEVQDINFLKSDILLRLIK